MIRYQFIWTTSEATEFSICSIPATGNQMPSRDLKIQPTSKATVLSTDNTIASAFAAPGLPASTLPSNFISWSGAKAAIINVPFLTFHPNTVVSPDYDASTRRGPTGYQFPTGNSWTVSPVARQTYSFNREFTVCIDVKPHFATGGKPLTTSHTILATNKGYLPQNAAYTLGGHGLGVLKINPKDFDSTTYARTLSTFSLAPTQCPATLTGFYVQFSIINPYHNFFPFQLTPRQNTVVIFTINDNTSICQSSDDKGSINVLGNESYPHRSIKYQSKL